MHGTFCCFIGSFIFITRNDTHSFALTHECNRQIGMIRANIRGSFSFSDKICYGPQSCIQLHTPAPS